MVSKALAVVLLPAVMLATLAVLRVAARFDPPDDERAFTVTVVETMLLLAVIQFLVLGWNLGDVVSMDAVLVGAVLWAITLVGYSYHRTGTVSRA